MQISKSPIISGYARDTGNIVHNIQDGDKQNNKKNTTQKAKRISNTSPAIKPAVNPGAHVLIYRNFIVVIYVFVSFYHEGFTSPFLL